LYFCLSWLHYGCRSDAPPASEVVARVGERVLTKAELAVWEAALQSEPLTNEMRAAFVHRWIEESAVALAARDRGLTDDPWVAARVEEITNQLVQARLWEIELAALPNPTIVEIRRCYQDRQNEFIWKQTRLVLDYWKSDKWAQLETKAQELSRKRSLQPQPGELEPIAGGRLEAFENSGLAPEIWAALNNLREGQVSRIFNIDGSYYLFQLVQRNEAGSPQNFEAVRDLIAAVLKEESHKRRIAEFTLQIIEEMRKQGRIEIKVAYEGEN